MTLKELNSRITGNEERCWFIFKNVNDMYQGTKSSVKELWTQVSDGKGGYFSKWDNDPIINKEVLKFQASGWQANIYYVVLKH